MTQTSTTLAAGTIHNPAEPRHFMAIDPIEQRVRILVAGEPVAESYDALRLKEVGHQVYDPVIYIPRADVLATLIPSNKDTHCPLKGDCSWFSLRSATGDNLAWSYQSPFEFAAAIKDHIAFDAARVTIEEHPA